MTAAMAAAEKGGRFHNQQQQASLAKWRFAIAVQSANHAESIALVSLINYSSSSLVMRMREFAKTFPTVPASTSHSDDLVLATA
jgi:hypothetical protein